LSRKKIQSVQRGVCGADACTNEDIRKRRIGGDGEDGAANNAPFVQDEGENRNAIEQGHEGGAVPQAMGMVRLSLFAHEMVGVVGLENAMMEEGVLFKGITEFAKGLVHDETVQEPFKQGGGDNSGKDADGAPEKK